jgi:putative oxidoreductase
MPDLMNAGLFAARAVLGTYLAAHGSQKLFGALGGPGLEGAGAGFAQLGLTPGKPMAALAGTTELVGGVLTVTGIADPVGPMAIAGTMIVATAVHRKGGPFATNGGYELPFMDLTLAALLMATGAGTIKIGPRLPNKLVTLAALGGGALAAFSLAKLFTAPAPPPETPAAPSVPGPSGS